MIRSAEPNQTLLLGERLIRVSYGNNYVCIFWTLEAFLDNRTSIIFMSTYMVLVWNVVLVGGAGPV